MASPEELPGMTRRAPGPADDIKPFLPIQLPHQFARPVLLLATASISDSNLFNNGLYQNCFIIYRLAEAIGWMPIFVVNQKPKELEGIPEMVRSCRIAEVDDILQAPIPVKVYMEIGMSISPTLRNYMKMLGAKNVKLYLGNILNIDIETPMFFSGLNFSHHVIGSQDEIWVSPHYYQHLDYAACINHVEPVEGKSAIVAPYVWDPCIITDDGRRNLTWRSRRPGERPTVIIMEPNISFQKSSIIPILIAEEYARANPDFDFQLVILNGDRLTASGYYKANIEPSLSLAKKDRIIYEGRNDMITVMTKYPHATAICHHVNNEFNYMVLEFLYAGFPVLHNCTAWEDFGYYYPANDTRKGSSRLDYTLKEHGSILEQYKGHARALLWRHSIYNPDIQKSWKGLLEGSAS
jgi:hypothetical protein